MKQHLQQLDDAERRSAAASLAIAAHLEAHEHTVAALTVAEAAATEQRRRADDALALERAGVGDVTQSATALADLERAQDRVRILAEALAQLDQDIAAQERARDEAHADQLRAARAALEEHAGTVCDEFRQASATYIAALRRVRAVERIARDLGRNLTLLAEPAADLALPALREASEADPPRVGPLRVHWYLAAVDREGSSEQREVALETARLRELGLELAARDA